ncbi:hypothetical protein METBIDRAFT_42191 [Metschnikowia bicuspidata var. bicuspidata NRRL YB-4993]|uniref:Kinetochore protein NDC80 n=1 Tax=Metschnikowia bicuspidata var. bicuspidata NRRL YB-4993 TaxID=869754 RepID=A0A1A0HB61_9ASCO|nr:hypothetical protein METBIDRAFT_42191 [Metschnikowia bicuspidata var. bicuspidata NRRL YB-4993]OBA21128.1 hypothetical protein METBIDRAFT_42191 [Metschnikowia bicuspidata var. bicuspidata NRRL YB-4993]
MSEPHHPPLAAQLLRKAQRLSLSGARHHVPESLKRRLTLLLTPAQNKRLSVVGGSGPASLQAGSNGPTLDSSQHAGATPQTGAQRRADLRPLRDKNYQGLVLKEIYDFCIGNRFELQTGHAITLKTLRQPTQKDFVLLFQFLYGKLDPLHRFTRSVESEVFILLKILRYPYLDGINRSSISAVGGQNWPVFLGMLYWLVKVNLHMLGLQDSALIAPDDVFDNVFIRYILLSYTAFIEQKEDYSDYYNDMKREFDAARSHLSKQADEKRLACAALAGQFETVNAQFSEAEEAQEKSKALENDLRQFSEYMHKVKQRQAQWKTILDQVEGDISSAALRLVDLEAQKKAYEEAIQEKGFSINEIDQLNLERDKISRFYDTVSNRIEDLKDILAQKESDIYQTLQSLQSFVSQYNAMTSRIPSREGDGYELIINSDLIGDGSLAIEPDAVLNKIVRLEKIKLLEMRSELKQELLRVQGETIRLIESVDQMSEKIFEQQEEIETVETGVAKFKDTQDEIYETMVSDSAIRSAQSEKLERDLQAMRIHANKGVIELETRNKELKIMLKESRYGLQQEREQLHETVVAMLQDVISFKMNIQEKLEDLEVSTLEELERELRMQQDRDSL